MALRVYNTMTRQKEEFTPINPGRVGMYVCGVTVYDRCHIGHARSQIVFDTVVRHLRHLGLQVHYVRNFTDVDDKIINRAIERKVDWKDVVAENIAAFYEDMDALAIARPTIEPRATDHIAQIIETISLLVKKGFAYAKSGNVYYSTRRFAGYAKLSKRNIDDLLVGARVDKDELKKDPLDFALWKAAKPGEPSWPSPWGEGRPGWHIECSAMSMAHLGMPFDIHGGGKDLVFPHHENEIAQSEAAYDREFARYWMHNGFVQVNHEKMAKSTGNFFTIRDILKSYSAEALRLFLLSAHYRSPIDYSEQSLADAQAAVDRLYDLLDALQKRPHDDAAMDETQLDDAQREAVAGARRAYDDFVAAMDDDFNTAKAQGHLFEVASLISTAVAPGAGAVAGRNMVVTELVRIFEIMRGVLGLLATEPDAYFAEKRSRTLRRANFSEEQVLEMIERRSAARKAKDWAASDAIRDELAAKGIALMDSPQGTTWVPR